MTTSEILNQIASYGVQVSDLDGVLTITGTIQAVHDADLVMDKLVPVFYRRGIYYVNYEDGRTMRTHRRQN